MKRRTFLRGFCTAAGAAILTPWARQALGSSGAPRRYVFVVEGNGFSPSLLMSQQTLAELIPAGVTNLEKWRSFSREYRHDSPLVIAPGELHTAKVLGPLAAKGLVNRSSVTLGLSSTITGGGHSSYCGALSSTRSSVGVPGGVTIDALLASESGVRADTPFDAVRLGLIGDKSGRLNTTTCAFGKGRPAPMLNDAHLAYRSLFAAWGNPEAFERRAALLDYAWADVNRTLSAFSGTSSERLKLEQYLESLEELQHRQGLLLARSGSVDAPDLSRVTVPDSDPMLYEHSVALQSQFDLTAAALIGGLTNVAVIGVGSGGEFYQHYNDEGGNTVGHMHTIMHSATTTTGEIVPYYQSILDRRITRRVAMIAELAAKLDAVSEEGGSMLDNTVIVYMTDNGERHHSEGIEWPVLMVGGQNLGFRNDGRTTVFPGVDHANNRQLSNLFNTLGHSAGMDLNDFGAEGPARLKEGPLSELWAAV